LPRHAGRNTPGPALYLADRSRDFASGPDAAGGLSLPNAPVLSDIAPDAIPIMARNLIENSLRPVQVLIGVTQDGQGGLTVENDCPPIRPAARVTLSGRFVRGTNVGVGSGIRLAIV